MWCVCYAPYTGQTGYGQDVSTADPRYDIDTRPGPQQIAAGLDPEHPDGYNIEHSGEAAATRKRIFFCKIRWFFSFDTEGDHEL